MTIDGIKKFDRQIRLIPDPFGRGFQTFQKTVAETTEKNGISVAELSEQYISWKWRK